MDAQDKHYQSALAAWRAGKETRAIVTPFAFKLAPELIGMPLARPWRRGVAIVLDLMLVSLLSSVSSMWIALLAAIATWVLSKRHEQVVSAWARRWLRIVSSLVIFVVVLKFIGPYLDVDNHGDTNSTIGQLQQVSHSAAMAIIAGKLDNCSDNSCVEELLPSMKEQLDALLADKPAERQELVASLFNDLSFLSPADKQQYVEQLMAGVKLVPADAPATTEETPDSTPTNAQEPKSSNAIITFSGRPVGSSATVGDAELQSKNDKATTSDKHSLIDWAKGIIADLGLGLSWGALYFTLFTALLRGQTPAKKLLGIRVVRLNGEPLTLWGAFGRYGGYGAGVTTGLLGFLQIYWDSNRQCIQDKIGETVVVMNAELTHHAVAVASESEAVVPPAATTQAPS
ncbi:RDD family protein [Shewanella dokdonensis]|uniref:RDD family protein n=1 Tax=Shewanella dokdonensis TaxID=712036 RepID=UPI00200C055A|nr:RDD family protein [Shewanella dokdonensis]